MSAGIAHRNPAPAKAMEAAAQAEIPVLKSRLGILDTIVTLAPLLGLLGTVVGMIGSFDVMSEAGLGNRMPLPAVLPKRSSQPPPDC